MLAVTLAMELFLMTCIGIFAAKAKIVSDNFSEQLTNFLMKIALPCLIFVSINSNPFSFEAVKNCFIALVLGFAVVFLSLFIGQICFIISGKNGTGRIIRYGLTFTHFSFMGIPIIDALFGDAGNLYFVMFLVPVRILYYSLTPQLFEGHEDKKQTDRKKNLLNFLNPCMCAVIIGSIVWVAQIHLPEVADYCLMSLNKICSPLGLMLCGMIIGKYNLRKLVNIRYFRLPLLRLLLMPLIFFAFARLLYQLGVDKILCDMIVIYSALPCASLTAVFAVQYETDPEIHFEAAGSVFFATLLSTITIPIWYLLV